MSKAIDLQKHTLNLRQGDFEKMAHLFPDVGPSVAVTLISKFVDKHYADPRAAEVDTSSIKI